MVYQYGVNIMHTININYNVEALHIKTQKVDYKTINQFEKGNEYFIVTSDDTRYAVPESLFNAINIGDYLDCVMIPKM